MNLLVLAAGLLGSAEASGAVPAPPPAVGFSPPGTEAVVDDAAPADKQAPVVPAAREDTEQ